MSAPMVYVDQLTDFPEVMVRGVARRYGTRWCHMYVKPWEPGALEALHAMAAKIGMEQRWFQNKPGFPHYDLVPRRREAALRAGAIDSDLRTFIQECKDREASSSPQT